MRTLFTLLSLVLTMLVPDTASAQIDVTDQIYNPSFEFEKAADGWKTNGFGPHGGTEFTLAHGSTFMEKWTGHGGQLGDAYIYQNLKELKPGTYTITVAAQNIQQGNGNSAEKGAFLYAGNSQTEFGACAYYSVTATTHDGTLTIGVKLSGCTGNWVCFDNFRMTFTEVADNLRPFIQQYVDEANNIDQNNSSPEHDELIAARDNLLRYKNDTSLNDGISDAFMRLKNAIKDYSFSIASSSNPYDITDHVINPSFEDKGGWSVVDMSAQSNDGYGTLKDGNVYMEKWTGSGGVGSCSVIQTVKELPAGNYRLIASAFNMTQDNEYYNGNTGAYIVGENKQTEVHRVNDYKVEFTVVGKTATIGFKAENASGNWLAVDNFRLYYLGFNETSVRNVMNEIINDAQQYVGKHMNSAVSNQLNSALTQAQAASTMEEMDEAAAILKPVLSDAKESTADYQELADAIDRINNAISKVSGSNGLADMQSAIDAANAVYNNLSATKDDMDAAVENMEDALFNFRVANGTGTPPTVTWNKEVIHGSRGAAARMQVTGGNIIERGFCWSTEPEPTVYDGHSSLYYSFNGDVFIMYLEPATQYYVRPYAINKNYAVGYGEPTRIITGFESDIEFGFNWGAPTDEENEQCMQAMETAVQYLRDWTSIRGYRPYLNYEVGKWGADCSYGGWISAGESYARNPGVMMHEMGHGIGVGQHWRYTSWDSPLHPTYLWEGQRANRVFAFFENQPDVFNADGTYAPGGNHTQADGDRVHVCYGLSGVTAPIDLLRQAVFYQGMYEDGMPAVSDGACPFYSFESVDTLKYYITNEKSDCGSRFLAEGLLGSFSYKKATPDEVLNDDSYAWFLHYEPTTGLYQLKNAKSGKYITYDGSKFALKTATTPRNDENIQLMPARVKQSTKYGDQFFSYQTYWMARGNRVENPEVLAISSSSASTLTSPTLNFYDNALNQHWAILDADGVNQIAEVKNNFNSRRLEELIAGSRELINTPHAYTDPDNSTTDNEFETLVNNTDEARKSFLTVTEYQNAVTQMQKDIAAYLLTVQPLAIDQPFDISFLIDDPALETGSSWTGLDDPDETILEFKSTPFSFTQTVSYLPKGTYGLVVNAFQRPGDSLTANNDFKAGNNYVAAYLYANTAKKKIMHVAEGGQEARFQEGGLETLRNGLYQPSNLTAAIVYLNHNCYVNQQVFSFTASNKTLTITLEDKSEKDNYWTVIDGFKLYYYGTEASKEEVTAVQDIEIDDNANNPELSEIQGFYTTTGIQIPEPLKQGVTIIKFNNGKTKKIIAK